MSGRRLSAVDRVTVALVAVLAVGIATSSVVAYSAVVRSASSNLDTILLREVQAYSAAIGPSRAATSTELVDASRIYLEARTGAAGNISPILLVRFADGKVLSNSDVALETAKENAALLEPASSVRGFDTMPYQGLSYRTATSPVLDPAGTPVAVFQAAAPTSEVDELARSLALSLIAAGFAVLAAGALISAWAARRSLAPLKQMAASATSITHATLGERIAYDGPDDELGQLADSLNSMLDRLENAFAAQRRFVADASHELRTPIAVIQGNLELITHPSTTESERIHFLGVIDEEVGRMTRLLQDMLDLARTQAGVRRAFQPLDVGVLLVEVAGRIRVLGKRTIRCACPSGMWIDGDPDLLEQALVNIGRNAVEHTAEGGVIELSAHEDGESVVVTITDDGPGIPADEITRVFDRFYRAQGPRRSASGGSGLGLAIAKGIVEMHGGTIQVENRTGGGASFSVRVPRREPESA